MHPLWFAGVAINPNNQHNSSTQQNRVRGIDMNFKPVVSADREGEEEPEGEEEEEEEGGAGAGGEGGQGKEESEMGGQEGLSFTAVFQPGKRIQQKAAKELHRDEQQEQAPDEDPNRSKDLWRPHRDWLGKIELSREQVVGNASSPDQCLSATIWPLDLNHSKMVSGAPMDPQTQRSMRHAYEYSMGNEISSDREEIEFISGCRDRLGNHPRMVSEIVYIKNEDRNRGGVFHNMVSAIGLVETWNKGRIQDRNLHKRMVPELDQHVADKMGNESNGMRGIADEDLDILGSGSVQKKLRLTKEQSALLEESFKVQSTLNLKQKNELAQRLNLRSRQVEVWFQNRRARTKLKQTEVDCELLKQCCESLMKENKRLQKEVSELRALKVMGSADHACRDSDLHDFYRIKPLSAATLAICASCKQQGPRGSILMHGPKSPLISISIPGTNMNNIICPSPSI